MTDNLIATLKFAELLNQFRQVTRVVRVNGEERWENDVEHSYQLVMLAWYLVDSLKLDLDKDLVTRYALVHDLVEVYAGDSYAYGDKRSDKDQRERDALEQLMKNFAEFPDLSLMIKNYVSRQDQESKFVYALDKLQPMINIYLDQGRTWQEKQISLQMIIDYKKDKVEVSPVVQKLFEGLVEELTSQEKKLFNPHV